MRQSRTNESRVSVVTKQYCKQVMVYHVLGRLPKHKVIVLAIQQVLPTRRRC